MTQLDIEMPSLQYISSLMIYVTGPQNLESWRYSWAFMKIFTDKNNNPLYSIQEKNSTLNRLSSIPNDVTLLQLRQFHSGSSSI